jgi:hypothetical protein
MTRQVPTNQQHVAVTVDRNRAMRKLEKLVEVWQVTEWRGDSIYRTKFVELKWVPIDESYYVMRENNTQYIVLGKANRLANPIDIRAVKGE